MKYILYFFDSLNESIRALFGFGLGVIAALSMCGILGTYISMAQCLVQTEHAFLGRLAHFFLLSFIISVILVFVCFGAGNGDPEQEEMEGEVVKGSESAPAERTITAEERNL